MSRLDYIAALWRSRTAGVLKNSIWAYLAMPVSVGLGVVHTGMTARMLGPEGVGVIGQLIAASGIVNGFLSVVTADAAITFSTRCLVEDRPEDVAALIRRLVTLEILCSVLGYVVRVSIGFGLPRLVGMGEDQARLLALYGLVTIGSSGYWVFHGLLRVAQRFSWTFFQTIAYSVIKTAALGVLFVWNRGSIVAIVLVLVALSVGQTASLALLARSAMKTAKGIVLGSFLGDPRRLTGEVWRYLSLSYGRTVTRSASIHLDVYLLGLMSTPQRSIGLLRSAKQVTDMMRVSVQGVGSVLHPEYSRLFYEGDRRRLTRLVAATTLLVIVGSLLSGAVVYWLAPLLVRVILGSLFEDAIPAVRILTLAAVVRIAVFPVSMLPRAVGNARIEFVAGLLATITVVVAVPVLVSFYGLAGAAWALVASTIFESLYLTWGAVRTLGDKTAFPSKPQPVVGPAA